MSADRSAAWQIARPLSGQWCGTRYGTRTAVYLADEVVSSSSRRMLVHHACRLASLAAGDELSWDHAERVVLGLGDALGHSEADTHRLWKWARGKGEADPRHAPTNGRMARPGDVIDRVLDLNARVHADDTLRGHPSAGSALKILDAFVLMAIKANRLEFAWSYRQIAEASGVTRKTVHNSRSAWQRHVNRAQAGTVSGTATRWRLVTRNDAHDYTRPEAIGGGNRGLVYSCASTDDLTDPRRNYWVRDGNKRAVLLVLDDRDPMTPAQVHDAILGQVHIGTVRRLLNRLSDDGVAVQTPDGWLRLVDVDEPPGIDYARARREQNDAERAVWRKYRASRNTPSEENR